MKFMRFTAKEKCKLKPILFCSKVKKVELKKKLPWEEKQTLACLQLFLIALSSESVGVECKLDFDYMKSVHFLSL